MWYPITLPLASLSSSPTHGWNFLSLIYPYQQLCKCCRKKQRTTPIWNSPTCLALLRSLLAACRPFSGVAALSLFNLAQQLESKFYCKKSPGSSEPDRWCCFKIKSIWSILPRQSSLSSRMEVIISFRKIKKRARLNLTSLEDSSGTLVRVECWQKKVLKKKNEDLHQIKKYYKFRYCIIFNIFS